MGRSQSFTCRTTRTHGTAIVVTCPNCKSCSIFVKPTVPAIDTCGFEYHSFRCARCASLLAGIIDPSDGELVLSVLEELEEPSGVTTIPRLGSYLRNQGDLWSLAGDFGVNWLHVY
jgi:phage FluMu protein Com